MAIRIAAIVALTFAAGAGLGRCTRPAGPPPLDFGGRAWVVSLDDRHQTNRHLAPFRVVVDGKSEDMPGAPTDGDHWRIDLADGRVTLFAATVPPPLPPGVEQ